MRDYILERIQQKLQNIQNLDDDELSEYDKETKQIMEEQEFYLQKGKEAYDDFMSFPVDKTELQEAWDVIKNLRAKEIRKELMKKSYSFGKEGVLLKKLNTLLGYMDPKAYDKANTNKYNPHRYIANLAPMRAQPWLYKGMILYLLHKEKIIADSHSEGGLGKHGHTINNLVNYIKDPLDNIPVAIINKRKKISEVILNHEYTEHNFTDELKNMFSDFRDHINNEKNFTKFIGHLLYDEDIKKVWDPKDDNKNVEINDGEFMEIQPVDEKERLKYRNAAVVALYRNGRELHYKDIAKRIKQDTDAETLENTISSYLNTYDIDGFFESDRDDDGFYSLTPKGKKYAKTELQQIIQKSANVWKFAAYRLGGGGDTENHKKFRKQIFYDIIYKNKARFGYSSKDEQNLIEYPNNPFLEKDSDLYENWNRGYKNLTKIKPGDWIIYWNTPEYKQHIYVQVEGLYGFDDPEDAIKVDYIDCRSYIPVDSSTANDKGLENTSISPALQKLEKVQSTKQKKEFFELINSNDNKSNIKDRMNKKIRNKYSVNQILYGPPGTGKTYMTKELAVEILTGQQINDSKDPRKEINAIYKEEMEKNEQDRRIEFVTFHQSYGYEEFVEGIRPVMSKPEPAQGSSGEDNAGSTKNAAQKNGEISYKIEDGIFKRICKRAAKDDPNNHYVLIIDEINRGNISKILGELITLLEKDKRSGAKEELSVTLPYSQESFSVPKNLFIIGTMNTADRSIAFLDSALRRRFEFIEIMPDYELLKNEVEYKDVDISLMLKKINERIRQHLDRDHQIGHSYFLDVKDIDSLERVFRNNICPLLNEYFYDRRQVISEILNQNSDKGPFIKKDEGADSNRQENWEWIVDDDPFSKPDNYKKIYGGSAGSPQEAGSEDIDES